MESLLGIAGMLAAITSIIVEVLKNILPKKFPTKALTIIVGVLMTVGYVVFTSILGKGLAVATIIFLVVAGIFGGLVVSFISMSGFDSFKEIIERFKVE